MAFASGSGKTQRTARVDARVDLDVNDWTADHKEPRDPKKLALVIGLGALSWVATYVGMLELIEANMGDLPLVHKVIIGFSVAMLMTMVVWLLDQLFAPIGTFTKIVYAAGYLFLTVISVGFGFGFYWKVLESRSEASRSAEGAVGQVQSSLFAASTRLEQLQATLDQLTNVSTAKAKEERDTGKSCPNSKPGDGPRRKLREDDAGRFSFASEFVKGRVTSVRGEMEALNGDLAKILGDDKSIIDAKSGTRNEFMKALSRKLDLTVTGFNAFRSDPQLKQIRTDLAERADRATFPDTKGATFACPDPQLSTALKGVVRAIDELPLLDKPKIAAVEGSEATIEAFRRLTATFYGLLSFKMPPSADELRELQKKAVQSVETGGTAAVQAQKLSLEGAGLSKRDYVPLAIAIFVDICLLLVSMGRPMNRLGGLVHKMREAERGPMIQILSRFNDIHRDPEIRRNFEVFRHVVFDFHGDYYVAVPLDAPYGVAQRIGKNGRPEYVSRSLTDIADDQVEAHILANLFTSFEKERIFTRVYSPFLTTRTIQKRLARQGSKFAHAKAFRIYRFRDGAYSQIILGAVMGAARRVEAEKRQRNLDAGLTLTTERTAPAATQAAPVVPPGAAPGIRLPEGYVPPVMRTEPVVRPVQVPEMPHVTKPHAYHDARAAALNGASHDAEMRPVAAYAMPPRSTPGHQHGQPHTGMPGVDHPRATVAAERVGDDHAAKFGPYATHVAAQQPHVNGHTHGAGHANGHADSPAPSGYAPNGHNVNGHAAVPPTRAATASSAEAETQHANNNTAPAAPRRPATAPPLTPPGATAAILPMPGIQQTNTLIPDVRPDIVAVVPPPLPASATTSPSTQASVGVAPASTVPPVQTVDFIEETVVRTMRVPASDPRVGAALWRSGITTTPSSSNTLAAEPVAAAVASAPAALLPPPLPITPPPLPDQPASDETARDQVREITLDPASEDESDVIVLPAGHDEWSEQDHTMLRRFAANGQG